MAANIPNGSNITFPPAPGFVEAYYVKDGQLNKTTVEESLDALTDCNLKEVRKYNRVLSDAEVKLITPLGVYTKVVVSNNTAGRSITISTSPSVKITATTSGFNLTTKSKITVTVAAKTKTTIKWLTRYIEISPTLELVPSSGYLEEGDGNLEGSVTQVKYMDGNPFTAPFEEITSEFIFVYPLQAAYPDELTYNFPLAHPQEMYLDGNYFFIETTQYQTELGDGNLSLIDGLAPVDITPVFAATLKTGDYFDSRYVFRFDEFVLFSDGSYIHFGPTVLKNTAYPLLRNILLIKNDFLNTVDLDSGYSKAGYAFKASAWPPIVLDIVKIYALKGGLINKLNESIYEDISGVEATPFFVGSSYNDYKGLIYDQNGNVKGYTKDYLSIAYDPSVTESFLYDKTSYELQEAYGNYISLQDHTEPKLKGAVFILGSYYWCVLSYISNNLYYIDSMSNIADIDSISNKDLFTPITFNKSKTT